MKPCARCGHVHEARSDSWCDYRCMCNRHEEPKPTDVELLIARVDRLTAAIEALLEKKT